MTGESTVEECQVPFPFLPLEIHERIIDRVDLNPFPTRPTDNDIKRVTLRVFSLVCRAWAIRVRMHLFENITLKDSNFREFIRLVRGNPILGYQTLHCHIIAGTYNTSHSAGSTTSCSITSLILVCLKWLPNLTAISFHSSLRQRSVTQGTSDPSSHPQAAFLRQALTFHNRRC